MHSDGNFTDVAREKLVNWVSARMMHTDLWCRYAFRHLHCSDVETTSPSEGAHHGLKSDIQVHSHCELATLLLADLLRTRQRYFEIEREAQERAQEIAANVKTQFETFVFKHLCIHTAKRMVKEYLKSTQYTVHRPRRSDADGVVAVTVSATKIWDPPPPFKIVRTQTIEKIGEYLFCSCARTVVHGLPCGHLLAYNRGQVTESDFHTFHTKMYQANGCKGPLPVYRGVGDHRQCTGELPELEEGDHEETHDNGGEGGDFNENIPRPSKNPRASRPYTAFEQECKRFLVKWGNHPAILTQAKGLITDYDNALGDVSAYRKGRPSSKPTCQGSRRR